MSQINVAGQRLLRIPLFYKILLANSFIVALGAVFGTTITIWHVLRDPAGSHYELIALFAAAGLAISFAANYIVLKLALTPLDRLQAAVDQVSKGNLDVSVRTDVISDERFDRLIATFKQMLTTLRQDAQRLHLLSHRILQAQEDERQRVARELHDEAAQALTSLLVQLRLLERSQSPEEARARVQQLRELTAMALDEVRRIALDLRPKILDDLGLEAALGWRIDEFNADSPDSQGAQATLQVRNITGRLPKTLELVFYRVAQEALTNVARHAQAQHVNVTLTQDNGCIVLEVVDDGVGFDVAAHQEQGRGLGLTGMRERMAMIGGALVLESKPGQGTRLLARAPIVDVSSLADGAK